MIVADLAKHLDDLARFLDVTGARKPSDDLKQIAERLKPFGDYKFADFSDFLDRALKYWEGGEVKPEPKKPRGSRATKAVAASLDLSAFQTEVTDLYNRAASPDVSLETIDAVRQKLDPLKKADLVTIAHSIELHGLASKTKADIAGKIVDRIRSRKQTAMRTAISDRPGNLF